MLLLEQSDKFWWVTPRVLKKYVADGDVSYMSSETLLFLVALFNNSHHERSKHYE
jgi:hypothetical protein